MSARTSRASLAAACCCILLLIIAIAAVSGKKPTPTARDKRTVEVQLVVAGSGCDKTAVVEKALLAQGFAPDEYVFGEQIDWSASEANSRGAAAFDTSTPTSAQQLVERLAATDEKSAAALNALLAQSGVAREVLLDPGNWVAVQWSIPVDMPGNTAFKNGQAVPAGTRHSNAGDIGWYFVKPTQCQGVIDGTVPPNDAVVLVRAGCKNHQTAPVVPARPGGAPAPAPAPKPTPTPAPTKCPSTICKGSADRAPKGDPGSGGAPGNGGAEKPGDTGYTPQDPAPTPKVQPAPPPSSKQPLYPTPTSTVPITPIAEPPS